MAINNTVLDTKAPELAEQIGRLFSGLYYSLETKPKTSVLSESFDIWRLSTQYLQNAIAKGKFPARKTIFQHHQIMLDGKAKAYGISKRSTDGKRQVFSVQLSKIAERIDNAISQIDKDDNSEDRVRLLMSRSFGLYAFWLVDRKQVYIVSVPHRFKQLRIGQYLSLEELMRVLQHKLEQLKPRRDHSHRQRPRNL